LQIEIVVKQDTKDKKSIKMNSTHRTLPQITYLNDMIVQILHKIITKVVTNNNEISSLLLHRLLKNDFVSKNENLFPNEVILFL
jgi:hypothetical protein